MKKILYCVAFLPYLAHAQTLVSHQSKPDFRMENVSNLSSLKTTPPVLSVSTDLLISGNDPENVAIRRMLAEKVNPAELKGKRIAIVTTDGVEEIELTFVQKILSDRGAKVEIVSPQRPEYPAKFAAQVPEVRKTHITTVHWMENGGLLKIDRFINQIKAEEYDAVFVPGGAWNPDGLRGDANVLKFIQNMNSRNKIVASICHGPQVLISAGIVKGKSTTAWWSMMVDLQNAGSTVKDQPVVVDGNMITSRGPIDLAPFAEALIIALKK
jgi:protease I